MVMVHSLRTSTRPWSFHRLILMNSKEGSIQDNPIKQLILIRLPGNMSIMEAWIGIKNCTRRICHLQTITFPLLEVGRKQHSLFRVVIWHRMVCSVIIQMIIIWKTSVQKARSRYFHGCRSRTIPIIQIWLTTIRWTSVKVVVSGEILPTKATLQDRCSIRMALWLWLQYIMWAISGMGKTVSIPKSRYSRIQQALPPTF